MTIKVGDKIPSVTLRHLTADGVQAVSSDEYFQGPQGRGVWAARRLYPHLLVAAPARLCRRIRRR